MGELVQFDSETGATIVIDLGVSEGLGRVKELRGIG
jgi:hypothetical protein